MVATEARKARRLAAALEKTGAADPSAHVKPLPPTPAAASAPSAAPKDAGKTRVFVGTGSKKNGGYTPPAILRAVANAARNKDAKASASKAADPPSAKSDWDCAECGKSNFAKRLMCFKCQAPKPGRKFTVAGMKGYEKRQAKREEKRRLAAAAGENSANDADGNKRKSASDASATVEAKRPKKTAFAEDGQAADAAAASEKVKGKREKLDASSDAPKRKSVKARDKGKAPKQLRDPNAPLEYLSAWAEAQAERERSGAAPDAPGFKPSNGWKLDKNVQNWLLHNVFDEAAVDDDVFAMTLMYAKGLRGGPLERLRESARERNFGKGKNAERARSLLRELANAGGES
jgi:hypothetical protein